MESPPVKKPAFCNLWSQMLADPIDPNTDGSSKGILFVVTWPSKSVKLQQHHTCFYQFGINISKYRKHSRVFDVSISIMQTATRTCRFTFCLLFIELIVTYFY